jgi:hypothetical protein
VLSVESLIVIGTLILLAFGCATLYITGSVVIGLLRFRPKTKKQIPPVEPQMIIYETEVVEYELPPVRAQPSRYFIDLGLHGLHEIEKSEVRGVKHQGLKVVDETGTPV